MSKKPSDETPGSSGNISFALIEFFYRVAKSLDDGAKTKKAIGEAVGLSHPVVNRRLVELEAFYRHKLLGARKGRQGRTIGLTDEGQKLAAAVKTIFEPLEFMQESRHLELRDTIYIATHAIFQTHLLPMLAEKVYSTIDKTIPPRLRIAALTIQSIHEGLVCLRNQGASLCFDFIPNGFTSPDPNVVADPLPCQFDRIVLMPRQLTRAKEADEAKKAARNLLEKASKSAPCMLTDLDELPLAFCDYNDISEKALFGTKRARRASLGTNDAVLSFVKQGWVGITIGWNRVLEPFPESRFVRIRLKSEKRYPVRPLQGVVLTHATAAEKDGDDTVESVKEQLIQLAHRLNDERVFRDERPDG